MKIKEEKLSLQYFEKLSMTAYSAKAPLQYSDRLSMTAHGAKATQI